jgi:hypothetical protein
MFLENLPLKKLSSPRERQRENSFIVGNAARGQFYGKFDFQKTLGLGDARKYKLKKARSQYFLFLGSVLILRCYTKNCLKNDPF